MRIRQNFVIIALGIIAATALAGDAFLLSTGNKGFQTVYPYLDPEEGLYDKKDLLVNMRPLREELTGLANGKNVSVYFEFLNTGANIRINDTPFFPGSLMKIPIAMAVMKKVEAGNWSMSDRLVLTDADKNSAYGDLYELPSGTTFTIEDLLKELLVQSDDTARSIFVRNLGEQSIEDVLAYLGLDDVVNSDMKVTAQRYSNFWRALYTASYLSPESSQVLLAIMDLPHDQKLLRDGIPEPTGFSHKIGVYGDIYSDSGIVYPSRRPYILTVMVESADTNEVHEIMKDVSRDVYEYVTQNDH